MHLAACAAARSASGPCRRPVARFRCARVAAAPRPNPLPCCSTPTTSCSRASFAIPRFWGALAAPANSPRLTCCGASPCGLQPLAVAWSRPLRHVQPFRGVRRPSAPPWWPRCRPVPCWAPPAPPLPAGSLLDHSPGRISAPRLPPAPMHMTARGRRRRQPRLARWTLIPPWPTRVRAGCCRGPAGCAACRQGAPQVAGRWWSRCTAPARRPPSLAPPPPAVRLIGTVGGKKDLKVFERSKLLPFAVGIKDRRRKDEADWCGAGPGRQGPRWRFVAAESSGSHRLVRRPAPASALLPARSPAAGSMWRPGARWPSAPTSS